MKNQKAIWGLQGGWALRVEASHFSCYTQVGQISDRNDRNDTKELNVSKQQEI